MFSSVLRLGCMGGPHVCNQDCCVVHSGCLQELEAQLAEIERDVRMLSKATAVRISTA